MRSQYFYSRRPLVYRSIAGLACVAVIAYVVRAPLWLVVPFLLLAIPQALQLAFVPILVVTTEWVEYRPYVPHPDRWRGTHWFGYLRPARQRVLGTEIASLAWGASEGEDNVGLRMRDGTMEYVSFYLVAASERTQAQQDILGFVARFTGPSRQEPS